ncbi:hypothetical protein BIFGAL_02906 [Bifidobacterium gallicum DSM 20093 = LMG 11596]|uniref:Uncharacterized protein n=1 Tax=Bifidobacterium gallicum DSM 20093 = LMG 11596 TaxID=561180 RepID=D1NSZ5_9BIFI|nr:hypothetical protein BIFGAL_02906 [Bifidobacterium gallicum DSM 20093 = LMG 11596]
MCYKPENLAAEVLPSLIGPKHERDSKTPHDDAALKSYGC